MAISFFLFSGISVQQKWFIPITHDSGDGEVIGIVRSQILESVPDYLVIDAGWLSLNPSDEILREYQEFFTIPEDRSQVFKRLK